MGILLEEIVNFRMTLFTGLSSYIPLPFAYLLLTEGSRNDGTISEGEIHTIPVLLEYSISTSWFDLLHPLFIQRERGNLYIGELFLWIDYNRTVIRRIPVPRRSNSVRCHTQGP